MESCSQLLLWVFKVAFTEPHDASDALSDSRDLEGEGVASTEDELFSVLRLLVVRRRPAMLLAI